MKPDTIIVGFDHERASQLAHMLSSKVLVIPDDPHTPMSVQTMEQLNSVLENVRSYKIEASPIINIETIESTGREKRRERRKKEREYRNKL